MSKRKGPLTKAEKFYINNNEGMDIKELSEDLYRSEKIVKEHLEANPPVKEEASEEEKSLKVGKLMARKKERGVTTMTPQASMLSDDKRSSYKSKRINRHSQSIHKIKPNDDS